MTFLVQHDNEEYENILPGGLDAVGTFARTLEDVQSDSSLALIMTEDGLTCYVQDEAENFQEEDFQTKDGIEFAVLRTRANIPIQVPINIGLEYVFLYWRNFYFKLILLNLCYKFD